MTSQYAKQVSQGSSLIPLQNLPVPALFSETEPSVSCDTCSAKCCRLEVMLITDTGVPMRFIDTDQWGSMTMARLDDGWCSALDRETMRCSIYENRPLICREFEMKGDDCLEERKADW